MEALSFNEAEIQGLFGHEAAEDEHPDRLRQYYFKTDTYEKVTADLSLRILVGHKGIGKSALFRIAAQEDIDAGRLPILIKPDDILELKTSEDNFLETIRDWKRGLVKVFAGKVLSNLGAKSDGWVGKIESYGGKLIDFLKDTFRSGVVSLDPANQKIIECFLNDGKLNIYVDDLDRGWEGRRQDIRRISALLNAARDLSSENRGISFRIGLRSDVYFLVRTSDESTDKIEGSVVWQSWTNYEILVLLVKRIETFFGRSIDEKYLKSLEEKELARYLDSIMQSRFLGKGNWVNVPIHRVLMSLIRKRPRDLVKLCTLAARDANKNNKDMIYSSNFDSIFSEYSQGRLQDTINEYRSELPDIGRLLINMKPNKKERTTQAGYVYTTANLYQKIRNIMQSGEFRLANGSIAGEKELAAFMYKINFLTARKESGEWIDRKYFEENRYLSNVFSDFGYDWEIHPAYRWALQPDTLETIYASLKLSK